MGFAESHASTLHMLNNTTPALFTQYQQLQSSSAALIRQKDNLEEEILDLKSQLTSMQTAEETYNREFLDRSAGRGSQSFFQKYGISTPQDWLFFMFFVSYAIICISVLVFTVMNSKTPVFAAMVVLAVSFIIGVMMTAVIINIA